MRARVVPGTPKSQEVRQVAAGLPANAWRRYAIKAGAKGELVADFAFVHVTRARRGGHPGPEAWLVIRRSLTLDAHGDANGSLVLKYFMSNAPPNCSRRELARVSGARWPIEVAFEEAKGELGMDQYEMRTWRGWHHQMTQTFLAHHLLLRARGGKSGPDALAGKTAARRCATVAGAGSTDARARARHRAVPSGAQLRRVSLSCQADRRPAQAPTVA